MKKYLSFILLFILTIICVGCSKNGAPQSTNVSTKPVDDYKLSLAAPSGAPAIAAAELAVTYKNEYNITMGLAANALQPLFVNKENDIIIAPINIGANMYSKNQNYVLASVLTWGNLYFASQKADFTLNSLNDADVTFFGENSVNDVIVKHILEKNNISPANITYLGSTNETRTTLLSNANAIVLVAEPALTVAKVNNNNINSISIQDLYMKESGSNGFPQAGCFVKKETINNHKEIIDLFLSRLYESANKDVAIQAEYSEQLELGGTKSILEKAIPNCNINYTKASDAKDAINYVANLKLALFGGILPNDEFYYE
ncbi:MAG: hypothetical protein ACI35S_00915 [Anaeroplasma sp.]